MSYYLKKSINNKVIYNKILINSGKLAQKVVHKNISGHPSLVAMKINGMITVLKTQIVSLINKYKVNKN